MSATTRAVKKASSRDKAKVLSEPGLEKHLNAAAVRQLQEEEALFQGNATDIESSTDALESIDDVNECNQKRFLISKSWLKTFHKRKRRSGHSTNNRVNSFPSWIYLCIKNCISQPRQDRPSIGQAQTLQKPCKTAPISL